LTADHDGQSGQWHLVVRFCSTN